MSGRHQITTTTTTTEQKNLIMFLNIPLILITIVGILFNGYIVTAVLLTRQMNTAHNILLLHLGTIDLLLGVLFLIFTLPGLNKTGWWLNDGPFCIIHGFLFTLLHPLVLWTICGLNCDRYYAIAAPLHYSHIVNSKKVLAGLLTGWFISLVLCIPPFFKIAPYNYQEGFEACVANFSTGSGTLWYSTLYTAFTLLLPTTIVICCNLKILMIARYHRHRIASAIYEVTLSAQVTITHQRNPFFVPTVTVPSSGGPPKFRSGTNAIYTIFQLVGSLICLYFPYYCLILWQTTIGTFNNSNSTSIGTRRIHTSFFLIVMVLLLLTSPINGFLYGVKNKQLRKIFKNYWRKKQTKSEVIQEIQARTPSTCGSRRPSLTPLGLLSQQRRLSETLFDMNKQQQQQQTTTNRRNRENWRPISTNSLNLLTNVDVDPPQQKIKQSTSCNTLKVPNLDEILSVENEHDKNNTTSTRLINPMNLIQKFFNHRHNQSTQMTATTQHEISGNIIDHGRRSPRITITRTLSDESDTSPRRQQRQIINKKFSTSSVVLFEKNWREFNDQDTDDDDDFIRTIPTTKPLLDNSSNCSNDTIMENTKIFLRLECEQSDDDNNREIVEKQPLLLKNNNINNDNNRTTILQSQEILD